MADIGLIGLGVMGSSLALNMAEHGYSVAVCNRSAARTEAFVAGVGGLARTASSVPTGRGATCTDLGRLTIKGNP